MSGFAVSLSREGKGNLERIVRDLQELQSKEVRVGWTGDKFHPVTESGKPPMTLSRLARVLHYGREAGVTADGKAYPAIPPRPFMDVAVQQHLPKLRTTSKILLKRLLSGKISAHQMVTSLGEYWVGRVRDSMRDSSQYKALAASTIARRKARVKSLASKNANKPLIDTGTLVGSLASEVVQK
jgi:hypothetical protein